jgi:pyruvate dehydrogenase E1 component alpha subunit
MSDPAKYRQKEEVETWRMQDPIERTQRALQSLYGVDEATLDKLDGEIVAEVDAAYEFADKAPQPPPEARFANIMGGD